MKNKNPYTTFTNYVLRTPLLPLTFFKEFTSKEELSTEDYKKAWNDPIIREAFFLASPSLEKEISKWLEHGVKDKKKEDRLKHSFLKYISRMSSRCTPFGLFAGCSVGTFGDETQIELTKSVNNNRHTRLDMNYLVALSQDLTKKENIKKQLLFYPNSSIYEIGESLRYVEYYYVNGRRFHQTAAVDSTEYLNKILSHAKKGMLLADLSKILLEYEVTLEEASMFIDELVSNQILISELEPSVSGPEFFDQVYSTLKRLEGADDIIKVLDEVQKRLRKIDEGIGNSKNQYIEISELLKELDTGFDLKYLFQTDMILAKKTNTLDKKMANDLKKGLAFLGKLSIPPEGSNISSFKDAFYERYEDEEIQLANALDVEAGVGYGQRQGGDINPLIDNLALPRQASITKDITWNIVHSRIQKKIIEAYKKNNYVITLKDEDFQDFDVNLDGFPDTMGSVIEVVKENGEQKIRFSSAMGSSGANLLGRFCHGDPEIKACVDEIIDVESKINKDKILAEIVHLPESRVGNIILRPNLHSYEIPYLAKSVQDEKHRILIDDLVISAKSRGKVLLRSKKHDKEVVPRLTNAHNFAINALPIYHFLADMQTQNVQTGVWLHLGPLAEENEFIPRIEYNNLILRDATWYLKDTHIKSLLKGGNNSEGLIEEVRLFRKELQIPEFVMLTDGDNELLINFENISSVQMFLGTVKNRKNIKLTEFLFQENGCVKSEEGSFTNQVIVSFYNEKRLNQFEEKDGK